MDKPRHVIHLNRDLNSSNAENNQQLNLHHPEIPEDDQAFEDEEVDIDDLPQELRGNHMENKKVVKPISTNNIITTKKAIDGVGGVVVEPKTNDKVLEKTSSPWNSTTPSTVAEKTTTHHSEDLRHEAIADDFVSKLIEEDESAALVVNKAEPPPIKPISSQHHKQPQVQTQQQQLQQQQQQPSPQPSPQHHQAPPPPQQEQIPSVQQIQWFYLDPKRIEQGPFSSSDMLEWCEAGYFPADLMLRRAGIDQRFTRLNEMTRMYGRVPFTPGPAPGPLLQENQQQQQPPQQQPQHLQQQQHQPMNQVQPNAGSTPTPPLNSSSSPASSSSNLNNNQAILQQIQQQHVFQQNLLRQQQQLYAIQQQPHLSEMEKAQLINKIMQLSILPTSSTSSPAQQQQSIQQPKPPTVSQK